MSGGIEYVYFETHDWDGSLAFWQALGFTVEMDLGRAGRLVHPEGGAVFLEEVPKDAPLTSAIYLRGDRSLPVTLSADCVKQDWHDSHWGSALMELADPDGRAVVVQDRS